MAIFEWDDSLSIGIEEVDNQHKELIIKLDELAQGILQRKGKDKIGTILRFMSDYGKLHFSTEEDYMAKHGYPGLDLHIKQHEKFKDTTNKLINELESEKDMESFASSVQRFLIDWLILHIKTTDQKFGGFLKEKQK
jgi:hemerythrin